MTRCYPESGAAGAIPVEQQTVSWDAQRPGSVAPSHAFSAASATRIRTCFGAFHAHQAAASAQVLSYGVRSQWMVTLHPATAPAIACVTVHVSLCYPRANRTASWHAPCFDPDAWWSKSSFSIAP